MAYSIYRTCALHHYCNHWSPTATFRKLLSINVTESVKKRLTKAHINDLLYTYIHHYKADIPKITISHQTKHIPLHANCTITYSQIRFPPSYITHYTLHANIEKTHNFIHYGDKADLRTQLYIPTLAGASYTFDTAIHITYPT